jgi:hypothetical protein
VTVSPGPESAAHNITAMRGRIRGIAAAIAAGETVHPQALDLALDALEAAVRHHDAEVVRDFADQEDGLLVTPKAAVYVQGIRDGADRIAPKEGP